VRGLFLSLLFDNPMSSPDKIQKEEKSPNFSPPEKRRAKRRGRNAVRRGETTDHYQKAAGK